MLTTSLLASASDPIQPYSTVAIATVHCRTANPHMSAIAKAATNAATAELPVTERENSLTVGLDGAGAEGMVRMLRQADAQIFAGYEDFPGLADAEVRKGRISRAVRAAEQVLSMPGGRVIMTGCGTSGRLGFLVARELNRVLRMRGVPGPPRFGYCVSGGDAAILLSDELPEDDPITGVQDFVGAVGNSPAALLVGITCGLSAAYVAGQVDFVLDEISKSERDSADSPQASVQLSAVLMGFNPPQLARHRPIELWADRPGSKSKTVRDVVLRLSRAEACHPDRLVLLNPVVGPEPVCASSRMKGGTCTKILLDTVLGIAVSRVFGVPLLRPLPPCDEVVTGKHETVADEEVKSIHEAVDEVLAAFKESYNDVYCSTPEIATVLERCGESLKNGGHVYIGGAGAAGVLGCIDTSEMPDTYGAPFDEVRAFIFGGWLGMGNVDGDLSSRKSGELYRISYENFVTDFCAVGHVGDKPARLADNDTILAVEDTWSSSAQGRPENGRDIAEKVTDGTFDSRTNFTFVASKNWKNSSAAFPCTKCSISFQNCRGDKLDAAPGTVILKRPRLSLLPGYCAFDQLQLKLALNAVSTGAQVMKGMVYSNHMINVGPTNAKIYDRCVRLVSRFAGVDPEAAEIALLRAIYEVDEITEKIRGAVQSDHIRRATPAEDARSETQSVLPLAIILASASCSFEDAKRLLATYHSVRVTIQNIVAPSRKVAIES